MISADEHPQITILQRPNESVDLTLVNIKATLQPIAVIIKHLAVSCELDLFASPQAQLMITGRAKSLDLRGVQASLLLDSLLVPLNMIWYQNDSGIHLVSLEETTAASAAAEYWPAALERTLRRFSVAFPGDYRIPSTLLSRANLSFIKEDFDRAATHYQQLSNLSPKDELLARLFFNTGKLAMRLGRNEESIQHFYHAVDQTYNTDFQSSCYWLVGQLCLETNRLEEAIKASGRALSTARIDQQKRLAALTMARSYLLSNQPYSANQILYNNRHSFEGTDLEPTAAVLGCYARYVGISDESSLNTESNRLLAAVAMAPDHDYESFIDIYIAARAYQQLGFQEQAIEKLTLAADSTTISSWRRRFLFELGVQLMIAGKREQAAAVFEFLIKDENDPWVEKSLLQLAQIYLHQQQFQNCIDTCQRLWSGELDEIEKKSTLDAMGRAYRELGEHHSAALCFAGMLPASTME
jgi:tetratricopeptide (TPR) repeat protein